MTLQLKTPAQLAELLGERLRKLRIMHRMTQQEVAERAGVSIRAVRDLETGAGSKIDTLLRVLKAVQSVDALDAIAPDIGVDPMAMLRRSKKPQRVRHERKGKP